MIANQDKQIKDFIWLLDNKQDIVSNKDNWNKCLFLRNQSLRTDKDSKYEGTFQSVNSAVSYIINKEGIEEYNLYECKLSELSYLSYINSLKTSKNIYRTYVLTYVHPNNVNNKDTYISTPYILMEVGEYMPIGTQVYHTSLHLNLVVCQISSGNRITCINPEIYENGVFQTIVVKANQLKKGWKSI